MQGRREATSAVGAAVGAGYAGEKRVSTLFSNVSLVLAEKRESLESLPIELHPIC